MPPLVGSLEDYATFQYQTGTIKIIISSGYRTVERKFQYQTGTIKILHLQCLSHTQCLFQYQTGTIKIYRDKLADAYTSEFQYQTGTIKMNIATDIGDLLKRFNTKLVRLKSWEYLEGQEESLVSIPNWYD